MKTASSSSDGLEAARSQTARTRRPNNSSRTSSSKNMRNNTYAIPIQSILSEPPQAALDRLGTGNLAFTKTGRVKYAKKGLRVHKCEHCDKTYTRNEHLKRHQDTHLPRKYACTISGCLKSFHREDLLRRHLKQHSKQQMHHPLQRTQSTPALRTTQRAINSHDRPPVPSFSITSSPRTEHSESNEGILGEVYDQNYSTGGQMASQPHIASTTTSDFSQSWLEPDMSIWPPPWGTPYANGTSSNHYLFSPSPIVSVTDTTGVGAWMNDPIFSPRYGSVATPSVSHGTYFTPTPSPYLSPAMASQGLAYSAPAPYFLQPQQFGPW